MVVAGTLARWRKMVMFRVSGADSGSGPAGVSRRAILALSFISISDHYFN
jgi:hypothetical protein